MIVSPKTGIVVIDGWIDPKPDRDEKTKENNYVGNST
jgi:hypothetical protein